MYGHQRFKGSLRINVYEDSGRIVKDVEHCAEAVESAKGVSISVENHLLVARLARLFVLTYESSHSVERSREWN